MGRFRLVLISSVVSNFGDGLRFVALPLLAYSQSHSALAVAVVTACESVAWVLMGAVGGVVVDRLDRRQVIVVANLIRAGLVGALGVLALVGQVNLVHVYLLALLLPALELAADTAAQPLLQQVTPEDQLERANSRLWTGRVIAEDIVGTPVAGLLFALSVSLPFLVDAGTFLVAAVVLLWLPGKYVAAPDDAGESEAEGNFRQQLVDGVRALRSLPLVRELTIAEVILDFALMAGFAVLVVYAHEDLGMSDKQFGLLFTAAALGSVVGGLIAPRISKKLGMVPALAASVVGLAVGRVIFAVTDVALVAGLSFFLSGIAAFVWQVQVNAYRQKVVPNALLGRVYSIATSASHLAAMVGALLAGLLAQATSPRAVMIAVAVIICGCGLYSIRLLRTASTTAGLTADADV